METKPTTIPESGPSSEPLRPSRASVETPEIDPVKQRRDALDAIHRELVAVQISLDLAKHGLAEDNADKIREHYQNFVERLRPAHDALAKLIENLPTL